MLQTYITFLYGGKQRKVFLHLLISTCELYVILRKIYGPMYENGYLRIKMNQDIYNTFKSPDILNVMKVCRVEWLGHVRMDDERTVKQLLEGKSGGGGEGDYNYGGWMMSNWS